MAKATSLLLITHQHRLEQVGRVVCFRWGIPFPSQSRRNQMGITGRFLGDCPSRRCTVLTMIGGTREARLCPQWPPTNRTLCRRSEAGLTAHPISTFLGLPNSVNQAKAIFLLSPVSRSISIPPTTLAFPGHSLARHAMTCPSELRPRARGCSANGCTSTPAASAGTSPSTARIQCIPAGTWAALMDPIPSASIP